MRFLGIDPGFATVGIGLIERGPDRVLRALDWMTVTTSTELSLSDRIGEICTDIEDIIREFQPDTAVVEKIFFATNKRTATDVAQSRGALVLTLKRHSLQIMEATPLQIKSAVAGDGNADKRQMTDMVVRHLRLKSRPKPDDAADALALALYGAFTSVQASRMTRAA